MRQGGGLEPSFNPQLSLDVGEVDADGLAADEQRLPDPAIGAAASKKGQYVALAVRQAEGRERVELPSRGVGRDGPAPRRFDRYPGSSRECADLGQQRDCAKLRGDRSRVLQHWDDA